MSWGLASGVGLDWAACCSTGVLSGFDSLRGSEVGGCAVAVAGGVSTHSLRTESRVGERWGCTSAEAGASSLIGAMFNSEALTWLTDTDLARFARLLGEIICDLRLIDREYLRFGVRLRGER